VAEATGPDLGALPMSHDLGHHRVIAGKPVSRPEAVRNLLPRKVRVLPAPVCGGVDRGGRRRTSRRRGWGWRTPSPGWWRPLAEVRCGEQGQA
jgi:hypothetical protein